LMLHFDVVVVLYIINFKTQDKWNDLEPSISIAECRSLSILEHECS
jgi:hypothetical protein